MTPKKLVVISSEKKPMSFWSRHFNLKNIDFVNLESSSDSFDAALKMEPDAIVLDEYFSSKEDLYQSFLESVNVFAIDATLFHVSPSNSWLTCDGNARKEKIRRHVFSSEFVDQVQSSLINSSLLKSVS